MSVLRLSRSPGVVFFALACAVLAASWAVATSSAFRARPDVLGIAVMLDVGVVVPVLYWFLVVRRGVAPARTLVPVVLLCIFAAYAILPAGSAPIPAWARYLVAPVEIGLVAYVVLKVRAAFRARDASSALDPLDAMTAALESVAGRGFTARLVASECALFYYALASWRRGPHVPTGASAFQPARSAAVLAVLGPLIALETVGVHLLVSRWSPTWAWVLTALSAYTMLWVFGDYRAMAMRPILVTRDEVVVRVGLRLSMRVPLAQVERACLADWREDASSPPGHLNMASPDSPNIVVVFREPVTAQRLFGVRTRVLSVGLRVRDAEGMLMALHAGDAA